LKTFSLEQQAQGFEHVRLVVGYEYAGIGRALRSALVPAGSVLEVVGDEHRVRER
jgi:hypothetical protein